jgi:hypothetical protein
MELPASHQQREQAEQATMMVLCSKQAALRNPAGRVVSLGLPGTRLDARRLGKGKPPTSRRFPIGHDVLQLLLLETPSSFEIFLQ